MTTTVYQRMKQRRKSAASWTSTNEVLLDGEIGVEERALPLPDRSKTGDGVTAWNSLPYDVPIDTDATLAANSDDRVPSQKAVKSYVDMAVTGLLDFKGATNCSGNPNYPAALKGDAYVVSAAGKIGGASGVAVDIGDVFVASADNAGGTQAAVGASWFILEHNLAGALLAANNLSDLANAATARTNLGLGNVDNTADTAKPVSTAQQTALDLKLTKSAPIEADVPIGSPVSMTSTVAVDVCFIDLTVGTWLVTGNVAFTLGGATTATIARGWMSATSATQPFPPNGGGFTQFVMPFTAGASQVIPAGSMIFTVASGTTRVYLSTRSTFSGGTMDAYGHILAVRIA